MPSSEEQRSKWREKNRRWRALHPEKGAAYARRYRAADPEAHRANARARYRRNMEIIHTAKDVPCMKCGGSFPTVAMDFHHRDPATKDRASIEPTGGAMNRAWSAARLHAEIGKCDVLCANCHRIVEDELRSERG